MKLISLILTSLFVLSVHCSGLEKRDLDVDTCILDLEETTKIIKDKIGVFALYSDPVDDKDIKCQTDVKAANDAIIPAFKKQEASCGSIQGRLDLKLSQSVFEKVGYQFDAILFAYQNLLNQEPILAKYDQCNPVVLSSVVQPITSELKVTLAIMKPKLDVSYKEFSNTLAVIIDEETTVVISKFKLQ